MSRHRPARSPAPGRVLMALLGALPVSAAAADPPERVATARGTPVGRLTLGPRLAHLSLEDVETRERLPLGGLGGQLRYRVSRRLGLEGSLDVLVAEERFDPEADAGTVRRASMPLLASALFYLFPEADLQLYGLAGLGVAVHRIEYDELGEQVTFATPVVQLGVGARYRLDDDMILDASLRGLALRRDGDEIEREPLPRGATTDGPLDYRPRGGDRSLSGALVTVAVLFALE